MEFAIEIQNLVKNYGDLQALKSVDINVKSGEFFALLGPNGAGKSTLINILCSLVNKTSGTVKISGYDIDTDLSKAKSMLGVVPQEFNFSVFETPMQILTYQAGYYGIPRGAARKLAEEKLKLVQLWDKRNTMSRKLSGGMKRRLMIARALMHDPKVLILDEPTAGVDVEVRILMWKTLQKLNREGLTIVLTTHYLEEAEQLCERVAIVKSGEIIACDTMRSILSELDSEVFTIEVSEKVSRDIEIKSLDLEYVNAHSFKVTIKKNQSLSSVLKAVDAAQLTATNITNKNNKLEQLFLKLTQSDT